VKMAGWCQLTCRNKVSDHRSHMGDIY